MQVQSDVDELTIVVSKLMKDQRKERMRNVRQGIKSGEDGSELSNLSTASQMNLLSEGTSDRFGLTNKKALLRARMKGV